MPIATFRGEATVAEIADNLFTQLTPRQREIAGKEILKANPQLADIKTVQKGSIIHVPNIPELRSKSERSLNNPDAQIAREINDVLRDYGKRFTARIDQAKLDAKVQSTLLKNAQFKKTVEKHAPLQELAKEATKHVSGKQKDLDERQQAFDKLVREMSKALNRGFA